MATISLDRALPHIFYKGTPLPLRKDVRLLPLRPVLRDTFSSLGLRQRLPLLCFSSYGLGLFSASVGFFFVATIPFLRVPAGFCGLHPRRADPRVRYPRFSYFLSAYTQDGDFARSHALFWCRIHPPRYS